VLDLGLTSRVTLMLNSALTFVDTPGDDPWGGTAATGLEFALGSDRTTGPDPLTLDLAFEGQLLQSQDATWRLQAKLMVPLLEGVSLPISATWSSRSEALEEAHVLGRLGLAVDTARLLCALERG